MFFVSLFLVKLLLILKYKADRVITAASLTPLINCLSSLGILPLRPTNRPYYINEALLPAFRRASYKHRINWPEPSTLKPTKRLP